MVGRFWQPDIGHAVGGELDLITNSFPKPRAHLLLDSTPAHSRKPKLYTELQPRKPEDKSLIEPVV
jgi:hypothetical protein